MLEFKVNEYLTLKLEGDKTNIYVNGKLFIQCKYLLIHIPYSDISNYDDVESIDEAIDDYRAQAGPESTGQYLTAEEEYWGHCSNLQTWYENGYDTRILHTNLSFPLLKALVDAGDPVARHTFKEEIIRRLSSQHLPVITYLINENYLRYLTPEEIETFAWDILNKDSSIEHIHPSLLRKLVDMGISEALPVLKEEIIDYLSSNNSTDVKYILDGGFYEYLTEEERDKFINDIIEKEIPLLVLPMLLTRGRERNSEKGIMTQISKKYYQYILKHFSHIVYGKKIYFLEIDTIDFWDTDTLQNSIAQQWLINFEDFEGDNFDLISKTFDALFEYEENPQLYPKNVIFVVEDKKYIEHERKLAIIGEAIAAAEVVAACGGFAHEDLSDDIIDWIDENRSFIPENLFKKASNAISTIIDECDLSDIYSMFSDTEESEEWLENLEELRNRLN